MGLISDIPVRSNGQRVVASWWNTIRTQLLAVGISADYTTVLSDYTATSTNLFIGVDSSSTNVTITLPTAAGISGREYVIVAEDVSNTVTLDGDGSETINGSTTVTFDTQYDARKIVSDGANWMIASDRLSTADFASKALDDLASVAINTSLISDTDSTDDLGSSSIAWLNTYTDSLHLEAGVEVLPSNHLLVAGDFPNTTTLVVYHMNGVADFDGAATIDTNTFGALTENGTGFTSSTNHLGLTSFCNLNGVDDFGSSTAAAYDGTDSFHCEAWIKPDDQTGEQTIMSKYNTATEKRSFDFRLSVTDIDFEVWYGDNTSIAVTANIKTELLDGNYHHVAAIYNQTNTSLAILLDGKIVAYTIDANLSARQNSADAIFEVGARDSGGAEQFLAGDITEISYQDIASDVLAWVNIARKIYAAGCQKLVTEETANVSGSKVSIHDGRVSDAIIKAFINTPDTAVTSSWEDATGFKVYAPEDGLYRITTEFTGRVYDNGGTSAALYTGLSSDGSTEIEGTVKYTSFNNSNTSFFIYMPFHKSFITYLSANDPITLRVKDGADDDCIIECAANENENYIQIEKIG